jgi:hypothetical protein
MSTHKEEFPTKAIFRIERVTHSPLNKILSINYKDKAINLLRKCNKLHSVWVQVVNPVQDLVNYTPNKCRIIKFSLTSSSHQEMHRVCSIEAVNKLHNRHNSFKISNYLHKREHHYSQCLITSSNS